MTSNPIFLVLIGGLVLFCLLIFSVPMWLIRYRPHLDSNDITRLNNIMTLVVSLPFLAMVFIEQFLFMDSATGNSVQATVSVAGIIFLMGVVAAYSRLFGIKADIGLGAAVGILVSMFWLITSSFVLVVVTVGAGFIILNLVFLYNKYTRNPVDLTSPQIANYTLAGFIVIIVFLMAYASAEGSVPQFFGFLVFILIFLSFGYCIRWLSHKAQERE
jgi:hypothetical protein